MRRTSRGYTQHKLGLESLPVGQHRGPDSHLVLPRSRPDHNKRAVEVERLRRLPHRREWIGIGLTRRDKGSIGEHKAYKCIEVERLRRLPHRREWIGIGLTRRDKGSKQKTSRQAQRRQCIRSQKTSTAATSSLVDRNRSHPPR